MNKIVSNTTPLITLLKISKLDILKKVCNKIIIPYGVYEEIESGKGKNYYLDLKKIDWIEIIKIKKNIDFNVDLDKGELETIILAKEINADLVILDEKLGRRYAKYFDLNVIGTVGILLEARKKGIITDIEKILYKIKDSGVWLSNKFIKEIIEKDKSTQ